MDFILLSVLMTAAGFVNSLAGGGGIITMPAYLAFGLNPLFILGTNKMSSTMGTAVAAYKFRKNFKISRKLLKVLSVHAFVFAAIGAGLSRLVPAEYLKFIILIVVPYMAYFVIKHSNLGHVNKRLSVGIKKSNRAAKIISGAVACYDGFFGPGSGTMYAVFLIRYAGFEIVQATALAKALNLASNVFALICFLLMGRVDLKLGFTMGLFNILGSALGVYIGKRKGAAVIRPMLIFVTILIIVKFIMDFSK